MKQWVTVGDSADLCCPVRNSSYIKAIRNVDDQGAFVILVFS